MITVLGRFQVQRGREAEAWAIVKEMASNVEASEPGVLIYLVHRSEQNPREVVLFEAYADQASFVSHHRGHVQELEAKFTHLMDPASFSIDILRRVTGFVRPPT